MDNIGLLKIDIFQRLPYGLFVMNERISNEPIIYTEDYHPYVESCKPYLRPMSSMTEEEFTYIKHRWVFTDKCYDENDIMDVVNRGCVEICDAYSFVEWINANHFDYRSLIEMGLALEAPKGMYKNKILCVGNSWEYYPKEFSSYEEYVKYLKEKRFALEAPNSI